MPGYSVNRAELLGRLGKDPESLSTQGGYQLLKFSMATERSHKDKSGQWQKTTDWHNIVVWGKLAEALGPKLHKGTLVYVEGRMETTQYEGRDGQKRYQFQVVASTVIMMDGGERSAAPAAAQGRPGYGPPADIDDDNSVPF